jgi:predicted DNA-binding transcriptional regulator AlpA
MNTLAELHPLKFLSYKEVAELTSLSIGTLRKLVEEDPRFPKDIRLTGTNRRVFNADDIYTWMEICEERSRSNSSKGELDD